MFAFDFETIARKTEVILPFIKADKRLKDEAKIAADVQDKLLKAALNINLADICLFSFSQNGSDPRSMVCRNDDERRDALKAFWHFWQQDHVRVTFNGLRYDIPLAIRQSQLLNVPHPPVVVNKYRADSIDLYQHLTFSGDVDCSMGLQNFCRLFGREEETGEDGTGSEVAAWVAAGEWGKVIAHGEEDIRRTVWLARRIGLVS